MNLWYLSLPETPCGTKNPKYLKYSNSNGKFVDKTSLIYPSFSSIQGQEVNVLYLLSGHHWISDYLDITEM